MRHCRTGIPYSRAHRFKRICSNKKDFDSNCARITSVLRKHKYPERIIDDSVNRADMFDRPKLLKKRPPVREHHTNLVITHSTSIPNVSSILENHHNTLALSDRLKRVFVEPPRVVYRRSTNLGDILTKSTLNPIRATGCGPCNKPLCQICLYMRTTQNAISTASDFSIQMKGNFTCDSASIVYLLECTRSGQQYTVQTPFRI